MKVAIVGAGLMGTATCYPLADNGHDVRLVGTHLDGDIIESCRERGYHPRLKRQLPSGVRPFFVDEIAQALDGVDVIVSGVNSLGVHWIGHAIGPYLRPGQLVVAVTKGLEAAENGDLLILPDVVYGELPEDVRDEVTLAAIAGPCIAGELAGRRQSCVVYGSRDRHAAYELAGIFRTSYYHIWPTGDLVALELCAAFKNAYTLGVGLAAGLLEQAGGVDSAGAYTYNLAAATFAQGCTEISRWLQIAGGVSAEKVHVFAYGLPSPGDFYVTTQGGRTVRLGRLLGAGHTFAEAREIMAGETLEAAEIVRVMADALPKLTARGIVAVGEFPLLQALVDVVVRGLPLDLPLDAYFQSMA
jgi:glycerol-3-phosphate dehydrogenase (NAD(P)+)